MLGMGNLHGEAYERKKNVNPGNKYPKDPV